MRIAVVGLGRMGLPIAQRLLSAGHELVVHGLGHLPPRLLGGEMKLDSDEAQAAVAELGAQLGLDPHDTAAGIVDLINESMLGALRVVTVQKGHAPADFALVSFGGAGGLHVNALAALLGCFPVIVPPESGVLSRSRQPPRNCASGSPISRPRASAGSPARESPSRIGRSTM
ncbi:MAG: hydantoinase/oxoprolinase family protein [Solirubrobacteraceae bacterium]